MLPRIKHLCGLDRLIRSYKNGRPLANDGEEQGPDAAGGKQPLLGNPCFFNFFGTIPCCELPTKVVSSLCKNNDSRS